MNEECVFLPPALFKQFEIQHILAPTVVEAKIYNAGTNSSSTMMCYTFGQTIEDFNKLIKKENVNAEALRLGMSTLHAA